MAPTDHSTDSFFSADGLLTAGSDKFSHIEPLASRHGAFRLFSAVHSGRRVMLKALAPERVGQEPFESMLQKEFETGYRLSHPGICQTIGLTRVEGLGRCIVMEYVDGTTLEQMISAGKIDAYEALRLFTELCDALAAVHSAELVHRDLKPSNVMVTRVGRHVKLIDFGLADSGNYAVLKGPCGTRGYMAPEVAAGAEASAANDVYALGKIVGRLWPKGWRRSKSVAQRCCDADPARRPTNVSALPEEISRRSWLRPALVVALPASVLICVIYFSGLWRHHEQVMPVADTVRVVDTVKISAPTVEGSSQSKVPLKIITKEQKNTTPSAAVKRPEPKSGVESRRVDADGRVTVSRTSDDGSKSVRYYDPAVYQALGRDVPDEL